MAQLNSYNTTFSMNIRIICLYFKKLNSHLNRKTAGLSIYMYNLLFIYIRFNKNRKKYV